MQEFRELLRRTQDDLAATRIRYLVGVVHGEAANRARAMRERIEKGVWAKPDKLEENFGELMAKLTVCSMSQRIANTEEQRCAEQAAVPGDDDDPALSSPRKRARLADSPR
jgi:hypothetical protein